MKDGVENPINLCGFYFKTQTRLLLILDKHFNLEKLMDVVVLDVVAVQGREKTRDICEVFNANELVLVRSWSFEVFMVLVL